MLRVVAQIDGKSGDDRSPRGSVPEAELRTLPLLDQKNLGHPHPCRRQAFFDGESKVKP